MSEPTYSQNIEVPTGRIAALPVDPVRKMPVPWFVGWIDGKPEFRAADPKKLLRAVADKLCWVCGDYLGRYMTFVIGPMCAVNRVSAEPPGHLECARYSAKNCPFLSKPHMVRREDEFTESAPEGPGIMIKRNPGVTCLWTCRDYRYFKDNGGLLFKIGEPTDVEWWSQGRAATRAEVEESVRTGLPRLQELASIDLSRFPDALEVLDKQLAAAQALYPAA